MTVNRSLRFRSVCVTALAAFTSASCHGKPASSVSSSSIPDALLQHTDPGAGLDLRISNGTQGPPAIDRATLAPATKIPDADATAMFARAQPIKADPADAAAFALRPGSQPPPRTGTTVRSSFPAPPSALVPPSETAKTLSVLRWMPEGAVPLAPELSVTFSQPMVAVTSPSDAATTTPVKLTPQPKGRWRWIGTRTIVFSPEIRFPQATTYRVEIPAGTKSATGAALDKAVSFSFETPAPTVKQSYPNGGPFHLDEPMFVRFDQKIDPDAVLQHVKVTAAGKPVAVHKLEAAEIAADKRVKVLAEAAHKDEQDGRWLAFRAVSPLPTAATVSVEFGAGTPSAEGGNTTKAAASFDWKTFPPLEITSAQCGYNGDCRPGMPFVITFDNSLDAEHFADAMVTVSPAITDMKLVAAGANVVVSGDTEPRTRYQVHVANTIADEFGQRLGADATRAFSVGDASPTFFGPEGVVVVDPAAPKPGLDFFSTNYDQLKVRVYKVGPDDYSEYLGFVRHQWDHDHPLKPPGKLVTDSLVKTAAGANKLVETTVDLMPAMARGVLGHAIAIVEPYPWKQTYQPPRMVSWVQSTKLAVDAHVDSDELVAYASELDTGKPAAGVSLELRPFGVKAVTDATGTATLPLGATTKRAAHYLVATRGDDVAFVSDEQSLWSETGSWSRRPHPHQLAWYVIDDRQIYKPGEEVHLKGLVRVLDPGKGGDLSGIAGAVTGVTYKVTDEEGNQIATGSAPISAVGSFDTKFTLPKTPNLGAANIAFTATGRMAGVFSHGISVEEFRRPEFEVSAQASQGPFVVGGSADVTVHAKYFAGGPLPGAPVTWNVTSSPTSFTPPNRDEFVFGQWVPWWGRDSYDDENHAMKSWSLTSTTDATGAHTAHLEFASVSPALPMSVMTSASVTDVNRQTWSASAALIVHPASLYVGVKPKQMFVDKGQPLDLDVIGVDLDGKAAPGAKIDVTAVRLDWEFVKGAYRTKKVDPETCAVIAAAQPVPCQFHPAHGGTYQVTATIVDAKGRTNQTKLELWVTGGDAPPAREVALEHVQLVPDKKTYAAGETAKILVQAPFYPAEGLVSWRRSGIVKTERIAMTGPSTTIQVPITDAMVPNMFVQVDLVGMAARIDDNGKPDPKLAKRPAYASNALDLSVPPRQRTLVVAVAPNVAKLAPGDKAKIEVLVRDAAGKPVADAETAVIVVDEAILALTGYQVPNPVDVMYSRRAADTNDFYMRGYVKLAKPRDVVPPAEAAPVLDPAKPRPSPSPEKGEVEKADKKRALHNEADHDADGIPDSSDAMPPGITIRSNENPLAAFAPAVKTGPDGKATVEIKMPDNLTRYRIVAVSLAGDRQFGKGESAITARLPLMVRPSPPRFLNFGDTFKLPVVVQNQTDVAMTVKLAVRATNAKITDGAARQVSVPANDRVEVQFPAAAEMAGTARFQIVGVAGAATDAAELALPVWTPATTEAFATYGVIDDGAIKQPVALPGKVVTQFGGLEVTTASTNLQALTDALLYLVHYPFECAEQRASRVLAIAALKDVLAAFKAKDLPSPAAMEASVKADVEHLAQMQNDDGGFAFWDRGYPSEPYLSVYVANALAHAKAKGFVIAPEVVAHALGYLKNIESHYPWFYSKEVRQAISAYALYTRKQLGELDLAKGQRLLRDAGGVDKVTMETDGWLLGLFAGNPAADAERKAIVRHALNKVSETAGAANFTTSYGDGNYLLLSSDRRVDGVMLESLIQEQKDLDLIPKLVTGLLAHRKAGRWLNTQESAFVLQALDEYFQTYEKTTPDFVARVWLGNDYAGDKAFKGRSTDNYQIDIAMKDVATHDNSNLTIQKDGRGRLYYRVGMTYAPASLSLAPADYGFVVERRYEAVDDPKDVTHAADGSWHVKAGARVRVRLEMVNQNRRYHVALVDPLPAGFEAMNPALAVTGPIPVDPKEQQSRGAYWWWYGTWYDHQNMRDERVEAFTQLLWEGVHAYDYVARATTPGNFVVPPPKAEEMYMPETFGRGGTDRVIVE